MYYPTVLIIIDFTMQTSRGTSPSA